MAPLPEPVQALVDARSRGAGMGAIALTAPEGRQDFRDKLTRAQRALLPPVIKAMLGLRDGPGRPGGWGPSPYKMDSALVERVLHLLVATPELAIQTATEKVRLALLDEPHFDERQWIANGWLSDGDNPVDSDVERIADKVRKALIGDQPYADNKQRKAIIDAELERLRVTWAQLHNTRNDCS